MNSGLIARWWQFLRERHDPFGISLMVAAFFGANTVMAWPAVDRSPPDWARLGAGYVLLWLCFLHMRLFDEVKDYAVDREFNPERPLARGLIALTEFGVGTLLCILVEVVLAAYLGWAVVVSYVFLLCFTLLMRLEFFVGDWLRPRLELYAITHTFSATMLGLLIHAVATGKQPAQADGAFLAVALGNWFVFNVFEFGRKTFGRDEEREGVDSYSSRLSPAGAVALLGGNVAIAYALLWQGAVARFPTGCSGLLLYPGVVAALTVVAGMYYIAVPDRSGAKLYRGTVTFYLLAYHLAILLGWYGAA
ncbi:MAG: 4-hydroxybenzoate polyprenyltransferase [Candidatus Ozemobacter sibiricus]|uniref:4-hydroxybenzoate polyprenyltransferase n=1 Tax=Candidatus Ozemobacter sibiricus TaxID=2268124 RepID=A0A367ZNY1_9BACT|nr:MAG: 4-hydroxybenzoate polyprenyltransferase [Candidatus Ozemobacter sibiricus]